MGRRSLCQRLPLTFQLCASLASRGSAGAEAGSIVSCAAASPTWRAAATWQQQQPSRCLQGHAAQATHAGTHAPPPFPGLHHGGGGRLPASDAISAACDILGVQLPQAALHAAAAAHSNGDGPASPDLLAHVLSKLQSLEAQFPGFHLAAALQANAGALIRTPYQTLRANMRLFQDLAPSPLPPVGQLMPSLAPFIAASPALVAAKLNALDALCHAYLSTPFPHERLGPDPSFLHLPDHAHAEAVYALYMILGRRYGAAALTQDVSLLGLPPSQIEAVPTVIRKQLGLSLDEVVQVQRVVAAAPAVMHMRPATVQDRMEQLMRLCVASDEREAALRQQRRLTLRRALQQQQQDDAQHELRELLSRHPDLLIVKGGPAVVAAVAGKELQAMRREKAAAAAQAGEGGEGEAATVGTAQGQGPVDARL